MTYLTKDENDLLQHYLQGAIADLGEMALDLATGTNLSECRTTYYKIPGHIVYPKTHDPEHCYLTPGNSFWVSFVDRGTARPVVVAAHKIIETRSLAGEIYTHRAFGNLGPIIDTYDIGIQDGLPQLAGRMGTTGGIVMHEDWQKRGLASQIARVVQALSIRHFEIDYQFNFTIDSPERRRFVKNGYGIEHSVLATTGTTPINGKTVGVMLNWSSRQEILGRMKRELDERKARRLETAVDVGDLRHRAVQIA